MSKLITSDYHIHTAFADGANSPEEVAEYAFSLGFTELGFSEHGYEDIDDCCFGKEDKSYHTQIVRLKREYGGKMNILLGVEADSYSQINPEEYDYVIGSAHYVTAKGKPYSVDLSADESLRCIEEGFDGDVIAFVEGYFDRVISLKDTFKPNIIGHLDLITKFQNRGLRIDASNPRYIKAYRNAVDCLLEINPAFEINVGAINRGYATKPYPDEQILKYIKERGGRVVISSDAHKKEQLLKNFDLALELVKSVGFKQTGFFDRHGDFHLQWEQKP